MRFFERRAIPAARPGIIGALRIPLDSATTTIECDICHRTLGAVPLVWKDIACDCPTPRPIGRIEWEHDRARGEWAVVFDQPIHEGDTLDIVNTSADPDYWEITLS